MPSRSSGLRFVHFYCGIVSLLGAFTLVGAAVWGDTGSLWHLDVVVLGVCVLLAEMLPLHLPLRGNDEEVNLSTIFSFAALIGAGLIPALAAQAVASLIQDVTAGKPLWRSTFNIGQYSVALTVGGAVLHAFGQGPFLGESDLDPSTLGIYLLAGTAFFVVNFLLVGVAVSTYQGMRLVYYLRSDLRFSSTMAGASLCLGPLVVAAIGTSDLLLLLFAVPVYAVFRGGRQASQSAHQAMHDGLTGLPNRTHFRILVDDAITGAGEDGRFELMLLDLNRFKEINDTLGHHYGDLLLREVGARLPGVLPSEGVVARLGGDEFAVLLRPGTGVRDPEELAHRMGDALRKPVQLDGCTLEADASIGIAHYPQDGEDVDTLVRRADVAMYHAKATQNVCVAYSPGIDRHSPARLALVADLRRALERDELVVWYQPKIDLRRRGMVGVEALIRWEHPAMGLLQPVAFIEMAEHTGLIKPLTHWLLDAALAQSAKWSNDGIDLIVSVNVSTRSLLDQRLPDEVAAALQRWGVAPDHLRIEITESAIMSDPSASKRILDRLHATGVTFSIDDFGTGYSSLAYLKQLPVVEIKIDRSFVMNMATNESDAVIVRSIIDLGANLGLTVVAEGVEDPAALARLTDLGCREAQGYYISRPREAHTLAPWLEQSDWNVVAQTDAPPEERTAEWRVALAN